MVEEHAAETETPSAEVEPDVEAGEEPVEGTPEGEPTPAPEPTHYTRAEVDKLLTDQGLRLEAQYNGKFETSRRDMQSFAQNYANTAVKEAQRNFGGQISNVKRDQEIGEALRDDPETRQKVLGIVNAYSPKPSEETPQGAPPSEPQPRTEQPPAETGALTVGHILAQTAKNQGINPQDPRLDWALDEGDVTKTTQRFQASIERIKAGGNASKGEVPAIETPSHIPEGKPDSSTPPTPESSGLKSGVKTAAQTAIDFGEGKCTIEKYLSYPENREKQNLPRLE